MYEMELKTHDSSDREVKGGKRFRLRMGELKHKCRDQTFYGRIVVRSREILTELCPMAEYCYTI